MIDEILNVNEGFKLNNSFEFRFMINKINTDNALMALVLKTNFQQISIVLNKCNKPAII